MEKLFTYYPDISTVPADLAKYIKQPISVVEIEPEFWEIFENERVSKEYRFDKDSLKTNEISVMQGEIVEIRNRIPVMKVIIHNSNNSIVHINLFRRVVIFFRYRTC